MATNEETNAAGTDTRPPMLVENDYESWKIRIHSQGLPIPHLQHHKSNNTGKGIWDKCGLLMQGSIGLFNKGRKNLFWMIRTFRAIGNESIQTTFVVSNKPCEMT
ncbi:hypothetical protein Tco_0723169 [Tanacetum coccineum]